MESLYAQDTPTAQERKLKLADNDQVMMNQERGPVVQEPLSNKRQPTETFHRIMDTSTESTETSDNGESESVSTLDSTNNRSDDDFGCNYASLPRAELHEPLDEEWQSIHTNDNFKQEIYLHKASKTEEGRLAERSEKTTLLSLLTALRPEKPKTSATILDTTWQPRQLEVVSAHCGPKPAITVSTSSISAVVGAKRPPPTSVSPPTFSWHDILCVQHLIERCLPQYMSKNEILIILKQQANVDEAFATVVWQKLEEQNSTFFRAYNLQLQLKEQILAFNCLVEQQKEIIEHGGKRALHYNLNRSSASRASGQCSLITASTSTALLPINTDARTLLRTPTRCARQQRTPTGKRAYNQHQHTNMYQQGLGATSLGLATLPLPLSLPQPSPIKTDLDTYAFFT